MNVPNILTLLRFLMIPVFGYFLYNKSFTAAVLVFLLAGLTDVLDGKIARKYNLVTSWGKIADPMADKLIQLTALVLLTLMHSVQPLVLAIVAVKEAFMGIGSIVLYKQNNFVVSANWYGKMATVIFYFSIIMIIIINKEPYRTVFISVAVLSTLFAFFMYIGQFKKIKSAVGSTENS